MNAAKIKEIVLTATNEFDGLYGDETNNTFSGLDGNDYIEGRGGDDTLHGDEGNDSIYGGDGNDLINGGMNGDRLTGGNGNDTVIGGAGNDYLYGHAGNDILDGGEGNDELSGDYGSDTYLFGKGSDQDVIRNSDTTTGKLDVIQLAAGITTADVTIKRDGIHLVLSINGTDDKLLVFGHFGSDWNPGGQIDEIKFADGNTWNAAKLKEIVLIATDGNDTLRGYETNDTLSGLGGADTIYGYAGNDRLNGNDGNDTLNGDEGDDILDGGAGNDTLDGGIGSDTYLFGRGSGQDVISQPDGSTSTLDVVQLGAGITTNDVTVKRQSDSLVISINGSNDTIHVYGHFSVNSNYQAPIDQVRFADGTIWDATKLKEMVLIATNNNDMLYGDEADETLSGLDGRDTIYGNAGNDTLNGDGGHDTIYGGTGNDTLDGGAGNDTLDGGAGNDTYVFGKGSGQDTISANDTTVGKVDVVQLGAGVLPGDVDLKRVGNNLVLSIKGTSDTLQVNNYFSSDTNTAYQVEQIKFADGTMWNTATVKAKILIGSAINETIVGFTSNDILDGGAGNDTLDGASGNDTLRGGFGDDQLTGGKGSDIFVYKSGEGRDVILRATDETNDTETLKLIDLLPSQVKFFRDGSDLLVQVSPSRSDVIRVQGHFDAFGTDQHFLDQVVFADGSVMNSSTFSSMATTYVNSLNTIKGSIFSRSENGTAQNDAIYGRNGHDKLTGGIGDDYLYGGGGDDTYVFRKGDGRDVIDIFEHAITPFANNETLHLINTDSTDVLLRRDEYDLLVYIQSSPNDEIRIIDHFGSPNQNAAAIDTIVFANGQRWNASTIRQKVLIATENHDQIHGHSSNDQIRGGDGDDMLWGNEGNDTIHGDNGNDSLYGGVGNDRLIGGRGDDKLEGLDGNDTFVFSKGDGKDTLYVSSEYGGYSNYTETLVLNDMNSSDVRLYKQGTSLYVRQQGSSTDHVQIVDHFYGGASELDQIIFADGSIWDTATINGVVNGTINPNTLDIVQDREYV